MNKALFRTIVVLPLMFAPAAASAGQPVDNYGTADLSLAKYEAVVAKLEPIAMRNRSDESLLLNLAMAYRHTGRDAEAAALYRRVLELDNVEVETASGGTVLSHVVARRALAKPLQLSSR